MVKKYMGCCQILVETRVVGGNGVRVFASNRLALWLAIICCDELAAYELLLRLALISKA